MKTEILFILGFVFVVVVAGCQEYVSPYTSSYNPEKGSDDSSSYDTQKPSSSGQLCTWMTGGRTAGCPSGERCIKATKDLDGDGLICSEIPTGGGVLQVCDGTCI